MASPPITIGELTDVPTFDSPIASPWAQEVSRRVAHRFGSTTERDTKYPANVAGAGAVCIVAGTRLYRSDGTRWSSDGEWSPITGTWSGITPELWTFDQWVCHVGDLYVVQIIGQVSGPQTGPAPLVGNLVFTPSNLPQCDPRAIGAWGVTLKATGLGNRHPGHLLPSGTGMQFTVAWHTIPQALDGAAVSTLPINPTQTPFTWSMGASFAIAGTYKAP